MITKKSLCLFIVLVFVIVSGCKEQKIKGLVSVRGVITYKGEPLEGAAVCFTPKDFKTGDRLGTGKTDAQGRFELRTIGDPGVLPGEYVVVVIKNELIPDTQPQKDNSKAKRPIPQKVKPLIPKRYSDSKTSDVNVVVEKSGIADWRLEIVD